MDSLCDNGCNTLSVLFTSDLTPACSPLLPLGSAHRSHARHMHERTHTRAESSVAADNRVSEGRGPCDGASAASMEAQILSKASLRHINKWAWPWGCGGWGGREERAEEEAQFNNARATSVSQMERLLPRGWAGVGLKQHRAPAAPHDCADIAA